MYPGSVTSITKGSAERVTLDPQHYIIDPDLLAGELAVSRHVLLITFGSLHVCRTNDAEVSAPLL